MIHEPECIRCCRIKLFLTNLCHFLVVVVVVVVLKVLNNINSPYYNKLINYDLISTNCLGYIMVLQRVFFNILRFIS
jgi:hypothetical protein